MALVVKNPPDNAGDITILGNKSREGRHGNPLRYSCLGDPMNSEELGELHFIGSAEKSQTQLSNLAHMQRFLHNKGNNQQSEKAACGKGENIYKLYI